MSLSRAQALIREFREKFRLWAPWKPLRDYEVAWEHHNDRRAWILDEVRELTDAIRDGEVAGMADGYIDILVFALGGLVKLGVDASPLFEVVIESQMTKEKRPGIAKLVKPDGWKHPDIAGLIENQRKR